MTRHETLQCVHEPFGDAYYFGPERLAERYENDAKARKESGYEDSTYRTIFDRIARENSEVRLLLSFFFLLAVIAPLQIISYLQSHGLSSNSDTSLLFLVFRCSSSIFRNPPIASHPIHRHA